jgi:hypothetical protein
MKRPPAKPFAWVAKVRFYHKINYERLKKTGGQSLVAEKKCLVWDPNILHNEKIRFVVN